MKVQQEESQLRGVQEQRMAGTDVLCQVFSSFSSRRRRQRSDFTAKRSGLLYLDGAKCHAFFI